MGYTSGTDLPTMGQEIFYCAVCQKQVRSADFENGQAFKLENKHYCLTCGPEMLRSLPKARVKEILKDITTPARHTLAPEPAPAVRRPSTTRRVREVRRPGGWIVGVAIALTLLGGVGLWIGMGSRPGAVPPQSEPGPGTKVPSAPSVPVGPKEGLPPKAVPSLQEAKPLPSTKDQTAVEALRKAREWAAGNPSDFDGAIRKFQDAVFLATGTPSSGEASKELDLYRLKQREFFAAELLKLEPEVKAACAEERFMKAFDILGLARDRHPSAEWHLLVGKRSREINDAAFQLLDRIKEEALEARKRGDGAKVKNLRSRVASWGIAQFIREFREAVDQ
jgi:hypothetical protein